MIDNITEIVREHDRNRYLAALFMPEDKRAHVLALYAFNAEILRIAGQVSDPQLGEIRLQWWFDAIDGIYGGEPQSHPVAAALAQAIKVGDLPKHALVNLAKAHQFDFYSDPMPDPTALEAYLGETHSVLIKMSALIMDQDAALECDEACGLAGVAYGLCEVLQQLPRAQRLQQCFLPQVWLAQQGLQASDIYAAESDAAISVVLAEMRALAKKRLGELRNVVWTIKPSVVAAFLHVALAEPMLAKAEARGTGVLRQGCDISALRKQWVLWKAAKSELF